MGRFHLGTALYGVDTAIRHGRMVFRNYSPDERYRQNVSRPCIKKVLDNIPGFIYGVDKLQFAPYEHSASDSIITDQSGNKVRDNVITVASYENFESTRGMDYAIAHFSEVATGKQRTANRRSRL